MWWACRDKMRRSLWFNGWAAWTKMASSRRLDVNDRTLLKGPLRSPKHNQAISMIFALGLAVHAFSPQSASASDDTLRELCISQHAILSQYEPLADKPDRRFGSEWRKAVEEGIGACTGYIESVRQRASNEHMTSVLRNRAAYYTSYLVPEVRRSLALNDLPPDLRRRLHTLYQAALRDLRAALALDSSSENEIAHIRGILEDAVMVTDDHRELLEALKELRAVNIRIATSNSNPRARDDAKGSVVELDARIKCLEQLLPGHDKQRCP